MLTAAHCCESNDLPDMVRLGDQHLDRTDDGAQPANYAIATVTRHKQYSSQTMYNDIALLKLRTTVKFNRFIHPACLWQTNTISHQKVIASGWGTTRSNGPASRDLLKVSLDLVTNAKCRQTYSNIVNSQVCAGKVKGQDTCQGLQTLQSFNTQ